MCLVHGAVAAHHTAEAALRCVRQKRRFARIESCGQVHASDAKPSRLTGGLVLISFRMESVARPITVSSRPPPTGRPTGPRGGRGRRRWGRVSARCARLGKAAVAFTAPARLRLRRRRRLAASECPPSTAAAASSSSPALRGGAAENLEVELVVAVIATKPRFVTVGLPAEAQLPAEGYFTRRRPAAHCLARWRNALRRRARRHRRGRRRREDAARGRWHYCRRSPPPPPPPPPPLPPAPAARVTVPTAPPKSFNAQMARRPVRAQRRGDGHRPEVPPIHTAPRRPRRQEPRQRHRVVVVVVEAAPPPPPASGGAI